jgi:hypothetical protein
MEKTCPKCKKVFLDKDSTNSRARTFCSRKCSNKTTMNGLKLKGIERPERRGEQHPNWVGDKVSYPALHHWVRLRLVKPQSCPKCTSDKPLDLCNLDSKYTRELSSWGYLCRSCHIRYDNKLNGRFKGSKSHCVNGHVYDEKNRAVRKDGNIYCKICNNERGKKSYRSFERSRL